MQAEAEVEVECRAGRTVCTHLRSDPPLTLRRTEEGVVHLVGSSAGPLGGDDLRLRIRVGDGASLVLRSVAASIVLPGAAPGPSRARLDAEVGAGAHLVVQLEPQILVDRADHEVTTAIRLDRGATLRWREETILGRHEREAASLLQRVRIDREGRPVLRTDLAVGPRWPDSTGPAGTGGARCIVTVVEVGGELPPAVTGSAGARAAVLALGDEAHVVAALGADLATVRASLAPRSERALSAREGFVNT